MKPIPPNRGSDAVHATWWGAVVAAVLLAGIFAGSRGLRDFDPALISYAGATVFSAFGLGYRYAMWLRRPPTRAYWYRGWQIFLRPAQLPKNIAHLAKVFWNNVVLQRFIDRRSHVRWTAHWFLAWGCLLAAAVTFPLSFGWVRFETSEDSQEIYRAFMFGIHVGSFHLHTVTATLIFNVLDVSAVMVLIGVAAALWRRGRDQGAISVQQFAQDMLPLILLFAVSVTGLFLTASTHLLHGLYYGFLSQTHAITVILTLLYLPFGKFFHIFQRPAQFGIDFYKREGAAGPKAQCVRCEQSFTSQLHVDDLKRVEAALAIDYRMSDGTHYQDVCPGCRRKNLALCADALWRSPDSGTRP